MGKHRHERFREAWAVLRIDSYDGISLPPEELVYVKEVWLTEAEAVREAERLNAVNADKGCRYFTQYTRLHRGDEIPADGD